MKRIIIVAVIALASCQMRTYPVVNPTSLKITDSKGKVWMDKEVSGTPAVCFNNMPHGTYYVSVGDKTDIVKR